MSQPDPRDDSPELPDFEDSEANRVPPLVDIHPTGDLILLCGQHEQIKLKVSSVVMSMASPVFSAMLKPHFKEGVTLAENKSVEISMPDDDLATMEVLCNALHLRNDDAALRGALIARQVLELALLCDKYDCVEAVRAVAECWLRHGKLDGDGELHLLVTAAYHFRHVKASYELGKSVVKRCIRVDQIDYEDVSSDLIRCFDDYRDGLYNSIIGRVESQIEMLNNTRE